MASLRWVVTAGVHFIAMPPSLFPSPAASPLGTPRTFPDPHSNSQLTIILLVMASFIATCFLLISYYAVLLHHRSSLRRRRLQRRIPTRSSVDPTHFIGSFTDGDDIDNHSMWRVRTVGLDEATIAAIPFFSYAGEDDGKVVDGSDCSVCLSNFEEGELVRLLPKCGHAFHLICVDTWLRTCINCPLCRAPVATIADATAAAAGISDGTGSDGFGSSVDGGAVFTATDDLGSYSMEIPLDRDVEQGGCRDARMGSLVVSRSSSSPVLGYGSRQSDLGEYNDLPDVRQRSISMDSVAMGGDFSMPIEPESGGNSSQKEIGGMVESYLSDIGGNSFLSRFRSRSSSVLPL